MGKVGGAAERGEGERQSEREKQRGKRSGRRPGIQSENGSFTLYNKTPLLLHN